MKRAEAIEQLQNCIDLIKQDGQDYLDERDIPLLDMAIEALSQPIVAKHFDIQSGYIYCSPQIAENVKVVVRCKYCKYRETDDCPMYWMEWITIDEGDGYVDHDYIIHDYTTDDGYCNNGERKGGDDE